MAFIPFFVIIPLGCAFIVSFMGKYIKRLSPILSGLASFALAALSFFALAVIYKTPPHILLYKAGGWVPPVGILMAVDSLTTFMLVTVNLVALPVVIYSFGYMKRYTDEWKFYTLFMLMLAGMNGIIITGDMFNMFVFLEISAIASYALVAFGTEAEELEASFKYAVMGSVGSSFVLLGIAILYSYTSTLNMADMASVLAGKDLGAILPFVSVLFLMGFGLKAALVPFHAWLPDAHPSAPAPISAMLSGVLIKVLGVYALARIFFNVFGMTCTVSGTLIVLAVVSMVLGSVLAFGQSDIKRLFAYSSISQIGYVVLGLALATPLSVMGALFHLFNHSVFKALLFLNAGAVEYSLGTRDLRKMSGLLCKMPATGYTSLAGALSICGVPPLAGFWSKLMIIFACIQAGRPGLAFAAIAVSILTLAYYFKALTPALFGASDDRGPAVKKVTVGMRMAMIALALITIAGGLVILPDAGKAVLNASASVLLNGRGYANAIFGALK
jgi:multicomponent Na+:H+ antiporter subunit D